MDIHRTAMYILSEVVDGQPVEVPNVKTRIAFKIEE
jgi:hypothetical protein